MGRKKKPTGNEDAEIITEGEDINPGEGDAVTLPVEEKPKERIVIRKAKLKDDLFLNVEYIENTADGPNEVTKGCKAPVHDDLKFAFRKLDDHLCRISCQFNELGEPDTFNINCKGFTVGGSGETEGICLIGYRGLDTGKYLNLVSPFTRWNDDYEYINELSQIIEECKHEVKLYLFEGKHKPDAQQELPFPEEEYSEPQI